MKPVSVKRIGRLEGGATALSRMMHLAAGDGVSEGMASDAVAINQARKRLGCAVDSQRLFDEINQAQTHSYRYPYGAPIRIWQCTMKVSGKGSKRQVIPSVADVLVTTGSEN